MCVYIYIYMYMYVCMHMCIYIYIYTSQSVCWSKQLVLRSLLWLVLENVAAITQCKMEMVWREVLGSLARLGYRAAWVTISARNVGCFMNRSRWILVAVRGGAAPLPCPPLTQSGLQKLAEARWNQSWPVAPPPAKWLVSKDRYASECAARLKMCGNCVVPLQVRAAVQALSSLAF